MKLLIGGIGYGNLRDLSFGPVMVEKLKQIAWPEFAEIEDVSYSPISVLHKFTDNNYGKIVFITAVNRGREPGMIGNYRPDTTLPESELIQNSIREAVTGTISLDNLLVAARFYKALPDDGGVMEVKPADETWGPGFTSVVEQAVDKVIQMVKAEVHLFEEKMYESKPTR